VHKTLRGFLKLLRKQNRKQQKALKNRPDISLDNAIKTVATAANEKTAGDQLAAFRRRWP
jgi:hypothetical protein